MKMHQSIAVLIASSLIFLSSAGTSVVSYSEFPINQPSQHENVILAVESEPIRIESNTEFIALGLPGEGTNENPFRFENLVFDLTKTNETTCLYIYRTDVSFVVRNCIFIGEYDYPYGGGINLWNVSNAIIANNTFYRLGAGSIGGENYIIANNTFFGQCLEEYDHDVIGLNINWNQINCSNVLVENNQFRNCSFGIAVYRADNSIFRNNLMLNCSTGIHQRDVSKNISIVNNISNNNTWSGMIIHETDNAIIANNTCNFNRQYGIWVDEFSDNNTIIFNQACWNGNASIFIEEPSPTQVVLSQIRNLCGIYVHEDSSRNMITWNDIAYNQNNIFNDGVDNFYDFNYWSDYEGADENSDEIGDTPYQTAGFVTAEDVHPRMRALITWRTEEPTTSTSSATPTTSDTTLVSTIVVVGSMFGMVALVSLYLKYKKT